MPINNGVTNQKGTPAFYSDIFANRPAFGYAGRLFISTDSGQIFEDTGTAWTLIADAGVGGGTLSSVCLNGNTTASGIVITANGLSSNSITNTSTTAGSILFAGTSGLQSQDNTNLFWDNTNKYLGIGPTGTPTAPLDIHNSTANVLVQLNATGTNNSNLAFLNAGVGKWRVGNLYNAGANSFQIFDVLNSTARLTILNTGATTLNGAFTSTSLAITGGTSSQFLKADGSIDSSTYLTTATASTTYVPYTGATANLNLGSFGITSGGIGSNGIALSQSAGISASSGRTTINGDANGIYINPVTASTNFLTFPNTGSRTYTYPNATGTLALTSDLSSYLPLAGGTLTGALNGTSANFSGNVGIGTSSPGNQLQIGDNNSTPKALQIRFSSVPAFMSNTFDGTYSKSVLSVNYYDTSNGSSSVSSFTNVNYAGGSVEVNSATSGSIILFKTITAVNTAPIERARISASGQFFIGGTLGLGGKVVVFNDATTGINIMDSSNNGQLMIFNNSGAVQIGSITTNGSLTAYNVSSDYRLKQDLKDYNGLDLVSKIKTYDYEWKSNKSRMYGVLAHELCEILPYAVHGEKDAKDMQQVDYSKIVPILIKAIQELNAKFN